MSNPNPSGSSRQRRLRWRELTLLATLAAGLARGQSLPPGFVIDILATNLNAATAMAPAPDGRIFIAEQTGRLLIWKSDRLLDVPALTLHVTDYWERGLIGLALAPDFDQSHELFLLYVTDRPFVHHVLSRFTLSGDRIDPASEQILFEGDDQARLGGTQPGGHQGGVMTFGPDGKLYVGLGEQTAGAPSQKLDTLQGKILRLNRDGSIPDDNPFVAMTSGKYRAIFARGIRNPFGLAAQPGTGRIFFTDVGGSAFEEVNALEGGANYGWPLAEGFSTNAAFRNPLCAYPPAIGQSICGGVFYPRAIEPGAGLQFPERWRGKFFFVDFMKHWVKALDPDAPTNVVTFARGFNGPVSIQVTREGALLVLNRGAIWRDPKTFVPNAGSLVRVRYTGVSLAERVPARTQERGALGFPLEFTALPRRLSATPLWAALRDHTALPELHEYEVNLPDWNPGVRTRRYLALPAGSRLTFDPTNDWRLPSGTVLVRHFVLPRGPSDESPLETRVIIAGPLSACGASYRWRPDRTEAELVDDPELAEVAPGRHWLFAGPDEALRFPSVNPVYVPDLSLRQLNRVEEGTGVNQIAHWARLGLLAGAPAESELRALPRLAAPGDASAPAETRVRSYLDVHCAVCHQPGGASRGLFDARWATPLAQAGIINGPVAAGDLGVSGAKIVTPGSPERSVLYRRLKATDFFRMPPVQAHNEPSPLLPVLAEWIRSLQVERADAPAPRAAK